MRSLPTTSMYLNTSYITKSGLHPIKLRVTFWRKSKYYKTAIYLSKDDYDKSYYTRKPRGQYIAMRTELLKVEKKAIRIIDEMDEFSFDVFEKEFYNIGNQDDKISSLYNQKIQELDKNGRHGTSSLYSQSLKSILDFSTQIGLVNGIKFSNITVKFLKEYTHWMDQNEKSKTTVGIYLRCLRAVFNDAVRNGIIGKEKYPFGKEQDGRYPIPRGNNTKKALSPEEIKKIVDYSVSCSGKKEVAIDFWLLSFYCGGINSTDLLRIKVKNYDGTSITFIREKTKLTKKEVSETIIHLTENAKQLIEKYKNNNTNPNDYIFKVLKRNMTTEEKKKAVNFFNNMVRKQMNRVSEDLHLQVKLGMMHARHCFADIAWNKRVDVSYIADCMSHSSTNTTTSYLKGITNENRRKTMNIIFEGL